MKKWIALLMVLLMGLFLFAACGDEEPAAEPEDDYVEEDAGGEDLPAEDEPADEPAEDVPAEDELEYYDQDFEITNSTEYTILGLYIMPTGVEDFSHNILADEEFVPGQTRIITFPIVATADYLWDIYAETDDGRTHLLGEPKALSTITALEFAQEGDELGVYTTNA